MTFCAYTPTTTTTTENYYKNKGIDVSNKTMPVVYPPPNTPSSNVYNNPATVKTTTRPSFAEPIINAAKTAKRAAKASSTYVIDYVDNIRPTNLVESLKVVAWKPVKDVSNFSLFTNVVTRHDQADEQIVFKLMGKCLTNIDENPWEKGVYTVLVEFAHEQVEMFRKDCPIIDWPVEPAHLGIEKVAFTDNNYAMRIKFQKDDPPSAELMQQIERGSLVKVGFCAGYYCNNKYHGTFVRLMQFSPL